LNDRPTLADILEVQRQFRLPLPALVEKDWYVVRALAAITRADAEPLRLVFGGGTALSRAHGLLPRMSEDIDLKIVGDAPPSRKVLRSVRESITAELMAAGFEFDPSNPVHRKSNFENRYTLYSLPYSALAAGHGPLRPEIKIETSAWPLRRPTVAKPVRSFIAEAFKRPAEVPEIACVAIVETAAEKFVALTRRGGAEVAGIQQRRDPTLVRHIYDLWMIREHFALDEAADLAREIMQADAETYGHQFPAYGDDPLAETLRAVEAISDDAGFAANYADLLRDMVYGAAPDFRTALTVLQALAERVRQIGA
jgi:predicted nucleotidyltransferase component of viral defense system